MRSVMMRLRITMRLLVLAGALAANPALAAAADEKAEAWLDMWEESLSLPLRFEAGEALAAAREGLAPEAGGTDTRRFLLSRVSPHSRYPDSVLHAMLLSEALVWSACREERAAAREEAWAGYGRLSRTLTDSLLPPWEQAQSFLRAAALRNMPSCRAKLKIRSDSGAYRDDCRDPDAVAVSDTSAASKGDRKDAPYWSPSCLRLGRLPSRTCLVRSGEDCLIRVEDFNAAATDAPIPVSPLSEARADLLRAVLAQRFKSGDARVSGAYRDSGVEAGKTGAPRPLRFRASSDSSRLVAGGLSWLTAYRHELPRELGASLDSARPGDSARLHKTRYGYFQVEDMSRNLKPARAPERIAALKRAMDRRPALMERLIREAYAYGRAPKRPDTLEFSLWLADPSFDTLNCRPMAVRSVSADNAIDALAWKYFGRGRTDSALGPFQVPYGSIRLKIHRLIPGAGIIPLPLEKAIIREQAAQGLVIGSAMGLWRHSPPEEPERPNFAQEKSASPFPDKRALAMALARLQFGADPGEAHVGNLEKLPEAMLLRRYASIRQERDSGSWMDRLTLTPEAARMNLWF